MNLIVIINFFIIGLIIESKKLLIHSSPIRWVVAKERGGWGEGKGCTLGTGKRGRVGAQL